MEALALRLRRRRGRNRSKVIARPRTLQIILSLVSLCNLLRERGGGRSKICLNGGISKLGTAIMRFLPSPPRWTSLKNECSVQLDRFRRRSHPADVWPGHAHIRLWDPTVGRAPFRRTRLRRNWQGHAATARGPPSVRHPGRRGAQNCLPPNCMTRPVRPARARAVGRRLSNKLHYASPAEVRDGPFS